MKCLITGGAGFIGSHLCERLLSDGHEVICLENFDPYYSPDIKRKNIEYLLDQPNCILIEADIRNKKEMEKIFRMDAIDKVVHLAAKVGVRPSIQDPLSYEDVNIKGALNLLELSKEHDIRHFIFGSSSSVYGISDKIPFSEDGLVKPISPYAASKRAGELLCYTYSHLYDIPISCLRFFTVYGPKQRPEMAIHKFTRLIDQGKEVPMYGDGSSKRDYTYITDIIDGTMNALNKKFDFEIFNLGNSKTVELRYLISLIEENLGKKAKIKQLPEQLGDVPITYADISKSKRLLGYSPKISIEEGVKRFVEWYRGV
ncbi:UDP-glucose 4-epimerase [subsurface metagenome]|jgi:UDP-glucuronate 4-epimerase